jgi:hypothetical protein
MHWPLSSSLGAELAWRGSIKTTAHKQGHLPIYSLSMASSFRFSAKSFPSISVVFCVHHRSCKSFYRKSFVIIVIYCHFLGLNKELEPISSEPQMFFYIHVIVQCMHSKCNVQFMYLFFLH